MSEIDNGSIVRKNLMNQVNYMPYCGSNSCRLHWPRLKRDGDQFACGCGYRTDFPADFIAAYKAKWAQTMTPTERDMQAPDTPHDFIDPASDGYEFGIDDEIEGWDSVPFRWVGVVFVGVIIGIAAFIGIVIGAIT